MQLNIVSRMRKEPPSRYSHLLGRYLDVESIRVQYQWETALKLRKGRETSQHLKSIVASGRGDAAALGGATSPRGPDSGGGGGGGDGGGGDGGGGGFGGE